MLVFVLLVVSANLLLLALLYFMRRIIEIRVPILIIAVGISIFFCILYPFLAAVVPYPQVVLLYGAIILAGAGLLYVIECRLMTGNAADDKYTGITVGDALAAVEGGGASLEVDGGIFHGGGIICSQAPGDRKPVVGERVVAEEYAETAVKEQFESTAVEEPVAGESAEMIAAEAPVAGEPEEFTAAEAPVVDEPEEFTAVEEPVADQPLAVAAEELTNEEFVEVVVERLPEEAVIDEPVEQAVDPEEAVGEASGKDVAVEPPAAAVPEQLVPGGAEEQTVILTDREVPGAAEEQDINQVVARAFDILSEGDKLRAAETFFSALKLNPPPKLASMLCIEISSIYLSLGNRRQALNVMEMVEEAWGSVLDQRDLARVTAIKNQVRREVHEEN